MHNNVSKIIVLLSSVLLFSCTSVPSEDTPKAKKDNFEVLMIGNSFTYYNDLADLTNIMSKDMGVTWNAKAITLGSHSLLEDCDPDDQLGKVILKDLKANQYTDIILQDKSNYPYNHYTEFKKGVVGMKEIINEHQTNADITLYETWGYISENWVATIPEMEDVIRYNTALVAKNNNLAVSYVGQAFTHIYENYPDINLYHSDNRHPSFAGSYLAALIHLATLTGLHVTSVKYQGEYGKVNEYQEVAFISEATKGILINIAEQVVFGKN